MREKIHSYLGFAKKSRNLISGYHSCYHGVIQGRIHLLILAYDLAENTKDKFLKLTSSGNIVVRIYGTKETLSDMSGEKDRGIFGITEKNLATAIVKEIDKDSPGSREEE